MTLALLFPGQGSQRDGMGTDLLARYPELTRAADELLGAPTIELAAGQDPRLRSTEYLQPVLFTVCAAACQDAFAAGERPDVVARP